MNYISSGMETSPHSLHSSCEPSELLLWLCHDDSTINIVLVIINVISVWQRICYSALYCMSLPFRLSVCHMDGSAKNGWS